VVSPVVLGPLDVHLFAEGRHRRVHRSLGLQFAPNGSAHLAVWAPRALAVQVLGDHNHWQGGTDRLARRSDSGIFEAEVPGIQPGDRYVLEVETSPGSWHRRADPFARQCVAPPGIESIAERSNYRWIESDPDAARGRRNSGRMAIYELHPGSWRWDQGRPLSTRDLAAPLAEHVAELGFTHVELMAVASHPFGGSWGYQVTGFFAPDSRYGTPDDLRLLIETLHVAGVGVLVDWVPAHFPRDDWALARFDGQPLYEHADARRGEHPDWGTLVFDHGRGEVRSFLISNALSWIEDFRIDGIRVDAVASMLYRDYSRGPGAWEPNIHGGREDLEAAGFLRMLCDAVHEEHPGALVIAEESTAWPGVTAPTDQGGLGFDRKWNLGWMHDTLSFLERDPIHRSHHHGEWTFPLHYAFDERWVLPLSHDEVVHGKGAWAEKFPGDPWQRLATLRLALGWQWVLPGAPLVFMGAELAEVREWSDDRPLDWGLMEDPGHAGISRYIADLNALVARTPSLWRGDEERSCTWWLDPGDTQCSVVSLARRDPVDGQIALIVANATPIPRYGYRLGVPVQGDWTEVLGSDDLRYGGSGLRNGVHAADPDTPWQGQAGSILVTAPPLGLSVFVLSGD